MDNPNNLQSLFRDQSKIVFQYFSGNIKKSYPIGWITIDQFIKANREPKQQSLELFKKIAYCESRGDMETKAKLKAMLYSFTPCILVNGSRSYKNITEFTGLLVLDFDHIHNAPEFKEFLFGEYDFIFLCWISPSRRGVKALVKIPIVTSTDEFKSYFYGIAETMEQYNGFDGTGQNCVLPLFQSNDKDILYRPDSTTWTTKGFKANSFDASHACTIKVESNERFVKAILKMIDSSIDKITGDGHPQLRSSCLAIGGYIANGYIDQGTALRQIDYKIESNHYLRKGISGYKKTARWAINWGMSKPIKLNFD